jgi:hypothetical protein
MNGTDRRAPGCEKKTLELAAQQSLNTLDFDKKFLAYKGILCILFSIIILKATFQHLCLPYTPQCLLYRLQYFCLAYTPQHLL